MKKNIKWTINLGMDFPNDWNDDDILFYLNESSWCADNLIVLLDNYSKHNGCICEICSAEIKGGK